MSIVICLCVQSLCAMKTSSLKSVVKIETVNFVNNGDIVISVVYKKHHNSRNRRKYILVDGNTQVNTILYEEKDPVRNDIRSNCVMNNQRTKIAFCENEYLRVFDIQKREEEWHKKIGYIGRTMTFNPENDNEIVFYSSNNNKLIIHSKQASNAMEVPGNIFRMEFPCIFHPIKAEFILNLNSRGYCHGNYLRGSCQDHVLNGFDLSDNIQYQRYSVDGSAIIAIASCVRTDKIVLTIPGNDSFYRECPLPTQRTHTCTELLLHSNNRVVFYLNGMSPERKFDANYLYSYDMNSGILIYCYKLHGDQIVYDKHSINNKRMVVSPDGKKIGIALDKKCILLSTLYMLLGTEGVEQLFQKVHLLQWYVEEQNQEDEFPLDVMNVMVETLLDLHYA